MEIRIEDGCKFGTTSGWQERFRRIVNNPALEGRGLLVQA